MKKSRLSWGNLLLCASFVILCGMLPLVGAVVTASGSDSGVSSENRVLADMPTINEPADIFDFPQEFETWYNDHLFLKENFVGLNSRIEIALFDELSNDQVILGTVKPWLFYSADDGQPLETYKRINRFTDDELEAIALNLISLNSDLESVGIDFILFITPDKEEIYGPDYMPSWVKVDEGPTRTEQLLDYLAAAAPEVSIIYPGKEITAAKLESDHHLYYETDTHWNKEGSWIGTRELLKAIAADSGIAWEPPLLSFSQVTAGEGDLQELVKLGKDYDSREYEPSLPEAYEVIYTLTAQNDDDVWSESVTDSAEAIPVTVYLAGDSFRWNMVDYMREYLAKAIITNRYYFDTEDLVENEPQIFVYEIAERFLHELSVLPGYNTVALSWPEG